MPNQARDVILAIGWQVPRREREAIAFGARIANRHLMHVRKPRQQAAIEQGERRTMFAALPQIERSGADVVWQALRTNVEIANVRRHDQSAFFAAARSDALERAEQEPSECERQQTADDPHQGAAHLSEPHEEIRDPRPEARGLLRSIIVSCRPIAACASCALCARFGSALSFSIAAVISSSEAACPSLVCA